MNTAALFAQALAQSLANSGTHCALCREGQGLENKKKFLRGTLRRWSCSFSFSGLKHLRHSSIHRNGGSSSSCRRINSLTQVCKCDTSSVISITADHLAAAVFVHHSAIIHLFPIWLLWVMPGTAIRSLRTNIYNWLYSPHPLLLCYHHFQAH